VLAVGVAGAEGVIALDPRGEEVGEGLEVGDDPLPEREGETEPGDEDQRGERPAKPETLL